MSHPAKLADACASAIGPAGVLARVLVGLGLVAMPGVIVGVPISRVLRSVWW